MTAPAPILSVDHLTMRFGGLVAIDDVSFIARRHEITAIIGPNGAGKTTVFNCLTGFYKPTVGMIALTRTLAQEFGEHNITCNAVPPRFVHNTAMSNESFEREDMKERFQAMVDAGPIRRHGEPEDIAGAVAWLVSDEAGYVTGQVIGVNCGRYI